MKSTRLISAGSFCTAGRLGRFFGFLGIAWSGAAAAQVPGGTLDPLAIPKYQAALLVPPVMPRTATIMAAGKPTDYYEIAVREFQERILPPGLPETTVWGYGSLSRPGTVAEGGSFNAPSFTVEALWKRPVRVKWVNDLVDANGHFLPHRLPVDQTLHWANPPGECADPMRDRDCAGLDPEPYVGPVPLVTHLHGAETFEWADGFPEAWYLPAANDIPAGFATEGRFFSIFQGLSPLGGSWGAGAAVFEYPNDMDAATLWYHDHALGITRLNVYMGPAGFYLLRGGPRDKVKEACGGPAVLPGPAPKEGDPPGVRYREIPIVIQDRSFNVDGSLFYPDNRAFFEGLAPDQLQIPFIPDTTLAGQRSDVPPIWNPEFFGNTMMVNGQTWPFLEVERRRYRFRFLNGSNSRFLILQTSNGLPFWQIGNEGGFLPAPVLQSQLLIGPAERADVILDFKDFPAGTAITLQNLGPDEPFAGGVPGVDFLPADPATTGQVMQFQVVGPAVSDPTTPPADLRLPPLPPLGPTAGPPVVVSLNELDSATVFVVEDVNGNLVEAPADAEGAVPFGPVMALLGTLSPDGDPEPRAWSEAITEQVRKGSVREWQIHNFTGDAHPIHLHQVHFEVLGRVNMTTGVAMGPELSELGLKDTVTAFPGEVTRVRARFNEAGLTVWHCHILEHEDNEMMRPYCITNPNGTQPASCALWDALSGMAAP